MNGAGYNEHDSLVSACNEFLHTLRIIESRFAENELVGKKAQFMALTHNRLMELFSHQFMQEPAILGRPVMQYRSNLRKKTANASFSEVFSWKNHGENATDKQRYFTILLTMILAILGAAFSSFRMQI